MAVSLTPVAGVVVEVSADAPATFDESGYNALTYSSFNDYDNVPSILSGFEMQSFDGIREGRAPYRGIKTGAQSEMRVPDDPADPGIIVVKAAFEAAKGSAAEVISLRVRDQNGNYEAAQALVGNFSTVYGGSNDLKLRLIEVGVIPGTEAEGTDTP